MKRYLTLLSGMLLFLMLNTNCSSDSVKEWYSAKEAKDAEKVLKIKDEIGPETHDWGRLAEELEDILKNTPANYATSFTADRKKYVRFWDSTEYETYKTINDADVKYLQDAYTLAAYLLAVANAENGKFDKAAKALENGLKLDSLNTGLLTGMGMLYTNVAAATKDTSYYFLSNIYYLKAFDSRDYVTSAQKAKILRGIGYNMLDLKEYDIAMEAYEASLKFEESKPARKEMEIINKLMINDTIDALGDISDRNKAKYVRSYEFFKEQKEKLPEELQEKITASHAYMQSKATIFETEDIDEFRKKDYWHYPLKEWDIDEIKSAMHQIAFFIKGIAPEHSITIKNEECARNVLLTLHYKFTGDKEVVSQKDSIIKMGFKHRIRKDTVSVFFKVKEF